MPRMTIDDLYAMKKETLIPREVSEVTGLNAHWLRLAARNHPEWIPFPFVISGSRTLFPRMALIRWLEGKKPEDE